MRGKPFVKGHDPRRHSFQSAEARRAATAHWARRLMDKLGMNYLPLPEEMLRPVQDRDSQGQFFFQA